ncbi:MAG: tRNA (5-methylaminomethyl-2-thiouridine)(34)-methyltransferase MnmD [Meiothermus ruber]|nr:tRNA (5-methylaminomethyl-2-thiouridine)(34)-methyltransferase MnmD [Meiothermus ruber]
MNAEPFQPLPTEDGSPTLLHPAFGETYSSRYGAWMQANELYLKLTQTHLHPSPRVLEVGFGLGVNFRATLESCLHRGVSLDYLSYEAFPVSREVLNSVELPLSASAQKIWAGVLEDWPAEPHRPLCLEGAWGRLEVRFEDVTQAFFPAEWATAIYLDPFSPKVNPEPWQPHVLKKLFLAASKGARLATYSVAGGFRRALAASGFVVRRVPGIGKKAWTVAERPEA